MKQLFDMDTLIAFGIGAAAITAVSTGFYTYRGSKMGIVNGNGNKGS